MSEKKILVPTDFTKVGDTAIEHAVAVSRATNADIHVLHIVEDKSKLVEARKRLSELVEKVSKETGAKLSPMVRIGNIFEDIDSVANEIEASLIIMGTHGLRGMQFITGSRALKIVTHSSVPFIIVQETGIKETGYDDIVVPLDLNQNTKQKLKIVANMSEYFNSRVHLISPNETDEYLKNQLTRNINYAKNFLEEKGIEFTVKTAEEKSSAFVKAVVNYAKSIDADLISIMNFYEKSLMGILGGGYEQQMITNEAQIPVLVINPVEVTIMNRSVFAS
jgi:nucleotide-binding universal stress UspA family protein